MRTVVLPVQPLELADLGNAGANSGAGVQVVVLWHVLGEEEADAGDLAELGFDNLEAFLDRPRCAIQTAYLLC